MHVLLSGASGLVGTAAIARFAASGHRVTRLVRATGGTSAHGVAWDPDSGRLDPAALAGVGAVVHLSGESIAGGLWTSRRKERIRTSRIRSTRLLAETIACLLYTSPSPRDA